MPLQAKLNKQTKQKQYKLIYYMEEILRVTMQALKSTSGAVYCNV